MRAHQGPAPTVTVTAGSPAEAEAEAAVQAIIQLWRADVARAVAAERGEPWKDAGRAEAAAAWGSARRPGPLT